MLALLTQHLTLEEEKNVEEEVTLILTQHLTLEEEENVEEEVTLILTLEEEEWLKEKHLRNTKAITRA